MIAVNHDVDRRGGSTADNGISLDKVRAFGRQANAVTLQHYLDDHERGATQRRIAALVSEQLQRGTVTRAGGTVYPNCYGILRIAGGAADE